MKKEVKETIENVRTRKRQREKSERKQGRDKQGGMENSLQRVQNAFPLNCILASTSTFASNWHSKN